MFPVLMVSSFFSSFNYCVVLLLLYFVVTAYFLVGCSARVGNWTVLQRECCFDLVVVILLSFIVLAFYFPILIIFFISLLFIFSFLDASRGSTANTRGSRWPQSGFHNINPSTSGSLCALPTPRESNVASFSPDYSTDQAGASENTLRVVLVAPRNP